MGNKDLIALDIYSLIIGVTEGKLSSFGVTFKIVSQKIKRMKMIKINVIFVHGIELSTFTEKLREIGEGPKFALSVLTRTAS